MRRRHLEALALFISVLALESPAAGPAGKPIDRAAPTTPPRPRMRLGVPFATPFEFYQGLAFSPDGSRVAATHRDDDGHVRLWDARTGRQIQALSERLRRTCALAFGPDGRALATCSGDHTLVLWNLESGEPIFKRGRGYRTHTGAPGFLASSPDGRTLACSIEYVRRTRGIPLWETTSGLLRAELFDLPEEALPVPLAFAPGGRLLVGVTGQHDLALWDLATGKVVRRLAKFGAWRAAFSPDGRFLAVTGHDHIAAPGIPPAKRRHLRLYHVPSGKLVWQVHGAENGEQSVAYSPDGRLLATGYREYPDVRLWDAASGDLVCRLEGPGRVLSVAFSPDGKTLASGHWDRTVLLWDLPAIPKVKRFLADKKGHPGPKEPDTDGKPAPPPERLSAKQLDRLWADLADNDAARAYRAIWALALRPRQAVPLLKGRLRPVTAPKDLPRLIADLGSGDFEVRERASRELGKVAFAVAPELRKALKALAKRPDSTEAAARLRRLLNSTRRPITSGVHLRGIRAIEALEHIGTPEAVGILKSVAGGAPDALETVDAKLALTRLTKWKAPPR